MRTNGTDQEFEHYDRSIRKHGMQEMTRTSKVGKGGDEKLAESAAFDSPASVWGIAASSVLAAIKIVGGILGNSYALIADGIESMLDILSSLVVGKPSVLNATRGRGAPLWLWQS